MGRKCTVCESEYREAIETDWLTGATISYRQIQNTYGIGTGAMKRHYQNHMGGVKRLKDKLWTSEQNMPQNFKKTDKPQPPKGTITIYQGSERLATVDEGSPMADFLTGDIADLLNGTTHEDRKQQFDDMVEQWDKDIYKFKHIPEKPRMTWPKPIRSRHSETYGQAWDGQKFVSKEADHEAEIKKVVENVDPNRGLREYLGGGRRGVRKDKRDVVDEFDDYMNKQRDDEQ